VQVVDEIIVMEIVFLQTLDVYYWWWTDCVLYVCATWCGSVPLDCSCVLLWIDTVVFY
jgi:hypothetical protein